MQLLGRLVRNRMVSAVLMLCGFALAAWGLWRLVERQVLAAPAYRLTAENVEIPPRPEWIRGDVRADVFRDASLDGPLSVVQTADLVERLRNAFRLHPWIASVDRVQIVYPAAAKV
jgi:cytochrome oxidase assembly protein ShyY1